MSTNKQPAPWQANSASQPETAPTETVEVSAEREPATTRLPQSETSSDATVASSDTQTVETDSSQSHRVEANLEAIDASQDEQWRRSHAVMAWATVGILAVVLAMLAVFGFVAQNVGWLFVLLVLPAVAIFGWMIFASFKQERDESNDEKRNPWLGLLVLLIVFVVLLFVLLFSQMAMLAFTAVLSFVAWLAGNVALARMIFVIVALVALFFAVKRRSEARGWIERKTNRKWHTITYVVAGLAVILLIWLLMPLILGVLYALSGLVLPFVFAFAALASYGVFVMSDEADKKAWLAMAITLVAWFLLLGMSDYSV